MASSSKKKTTMAKLNREAKVRDKRLRKQDRKDARKQAAADNLHAPEGTTAEDDVVVDEATEPRTA